MSEKCVACNSSPVYISFMGNCECSNPKCKYYSAKLFPQETVPTEEETLANAKNSPEEKTLTDKDIQNDTGHQYIWRTHHYDFGD